MEDNLFAAIVESEAMVSKYRAAPPSLTPSGNSPAFSPPSSGTRKAVPSDQADDQRPILQQNTVNLPKYRICIDSVDKIVEGTMLTTSYIAYRIRFTRMSDLQSHATWKRYKELSTWFQQLQQKHPELASGEVKFPAASDTWMGNQNDPLGEFVMKRKLDLETFLKSLFAEYAVLVRHPSVMEFFELGALPAETMSVMATRLAARELQDASKSSSAKGSAGGSTAAAEAGGLSAPQQDLSWYHYDRSVMRDILSRDCAYDPATASMVRKDELAYRGGRADTTVAEILDFGEAHSRMQAARQQ